MVNVIVTSAGTSGPRGNSVLSGVGAPSDSLGFDGDFYINTTNINEIYGPKASGIWPAAVPFGGGGAKTNFTASLAPTVNNDSTQGYAAGSLWVDTVTSVYYVCPNASAGAAIWVPVLVVGTTAGTVAAGNDSRITGALQTGSTAGGDLSGALPDPTVTTTHLSAPLPVAQGGTGSGTQNFVDLSTAQVIAGFKQFTGEVTVPSPVNPTDAADKQYVDGLVSAGLTVKESVAAGTVTALPTNTYSNGSAGVGATLTANADGVLVVDGYTVLLNDRLIVKNESDLTNNGIYTVTTLGTPSVEYVLTRSTDMDTPTTIAGSAAFINHGTVNEGAGWVVVNTGPYTIGTTPVEWTQLTSPGLINAGTGLTETGNVISLIVPVAQSSLPAATTSVEGIVQLTGDLSGTANAPTVVSTHLASPLPLLQGGLAATTASGGRTTLGLGTSAVSNIDTTASDFQPLGTANAGSTGQVADAGHVHPSDGVVLSSDAASTVTSETSYGIAPVVGTDITYAREDHKHGTPSLTTSPPSVTEGIGQAAALGTATTPSLADHVHPLAAAGTPTNSAVTDTTSTGNATTFAASNHTHGREGFGTPTASTTYGLSSTTGTASTVPHADHTHGTPSLTTTAPATTEAIGTAAALGVATTPALADHVHPMAAAGTPTNSAVTDSAAIGAATTFSSSNHVHGREGFGTVTALSSFNTASSSGSAATVSHSDHVHGAPALPVASSGTEGVIQLTGDLGNTAASPQVLSTHLSAPLPIAQGGTSTAVAPAYGQSPIASSGTAASWALLPSFLSTGLTTGGLMTQDGSILNAFDITAATGFIADYVTSPTAPTVAPVSISAQTVTLSGGALSQVVNYWYANSSGTILSQATALTSAQKRQNIFLGVTWSALSTGNLYAIMSNPIIQNQPSPNINALFEAIGGINISGNVVSANGANLNINKSAGTIHGASTNYQAGGANNPFLLTNPAETAATFRYVTQLTNSQSDTTTSIAVASYDVGGTITTLATNADSAIHRVYLIPTGVVGAQIVIQYGQLHYSSLAAALYGWLTEPFVVCPDLGTRATLIGYIIAVKNATSLTNAAQATFVPASRFAVS